MIKRNGCMTKLAMLRWRNKRFSIRGWTITPQLITIWVLWDPSIKITATLNAMLSRELFYMHQKLFIELVQDTQTT